VALVRTDVSEELSSIIRVIRIGELGKHYPKLATDARYEEVPPPHATRRNILEDGILHSPAVRTSNFTEH
jgi:hypothetical protein